jgi:hypothetical protein
MIKAIGTELNFPAASHGVSMSDTFYPSPDKPELKIDD